MLYHAERHVTRRSAEPPTDSAKRIAVRRMCHAPTDVALPRSVAASGAVVTTNLFHDARILQLSCEPMPGKKKFEAGPEPRLVVRGKVCATACSLPAGRGEGQHRRKGSGDVREGRRGQYRLVPPASVPESIP